MANIGKLPYGVLGTALKFGLSEEIEFVPVFMSSKQRRKNKFFTVGFVQFVKKSALDPQNLLFFSFSFWDHLRRRRLRRCSQDLSMCVNG